MGSAWFTLKMYLALGSEKWISSSSQQDRVSDGTTLVMQDQLRRLMKN